MGAEQRRGGEAAAIRAHRGGKEGHNKRAVDIEDKEPLTRQSRGGAEEEVAEPPLVFDFFMRFSSVSLP